MFKLTKKGQASSTFQLLIAAVVALAILGVLLNILNVLPGLNKDPTKTTKTLLTDQINNPGAESCTDPVTFTKSKSTLSAEGITVNTGVEMSQVFFANIENIPNFTPSGAETSNNLLRYNASSSKKVMMCIICSSTKQTLSGAIKANGKDSDQDITVPEELEDGETLCVIYPRKTSAS
ncbi:MAG TPA: hypothetical protein P5530_03590 [Candidatus Diapherotrites archaeon]|nr:hypothetical protein [Candidatus Diapherotrites archaeon]